MEKPANTVEYDPETKTEIKTFYRMKNGKYYACKFVRVNGVHVKKPCVKRPPGVRKPYKTRKDKGVPRKQYKPYKPRTGIPAKRKPYAPRKDIGSVRKTYRRREITTDYHKFESRYEDKQLFEGKREILKSAHKINGVLSLKELGKLIMANPNIDIAKTTILVNV